MQACMTLLFQEQAPKIKKKGNEIFNMPMGCYDGEEVWELQRSYISSRLKVFFKRDDVRFYRNNSFGIFLQSLGSSGCLKAVINRSAV